MRAIKWMLVFLAVVAARAQTLEKALDAITRNDTRAAEKALETLANADGRDPEVVLARGVYLFQLGKFVQAQKALRSARRNLPAARTGGNGGVPRSPPHAAVAF